MIVTRLMSGAIFIQSLFYFYFAEWMTEQYIHAHASPSQVLESGEPNWINGALLAIAAFLYWQFRESRLPIQILAIIGAVIGVRDFIAARSIVMSFWAFLQGDVVSAGVISAAWFGVIGVLAVADFFAMRSTSRRYPNRR